MRTSRAVLALLLFPAIASASVRFEDWSRGGLQERVDAAARARRPVLLVVTQPDWCPPCIVLDRNWLKNAEETAVAAIARDMVALEVHGYDEAGAAALATQGIRFPGTPTTFVFRPEVPGRKLADAPLLGAIVGAPKDFPDRLRAIAAMPSAPIDAGTAVGAGGDPLSRAIALLASARAHVSRGEAEAADAAFAAILDLPPSEDEGQRERLDEMRAEAEWGRAGEVALRLRKDWAAALEGIDRYVAAHGRPDALAGAIAYGRAWALGRLGRVDEALAEMNHHVLAAGTASAYDQFGYFCFRLEAPLALSRGEAAMREGVAKFPEDGAIRQELGRILRRQGRLAEAEAELARAVALATDEMDRVVYQGQLDHVRSEIAAAGSGGGERPPAKPTRKRSRAKRSRTG